MENCAIQIMDITTLKAVLADLRERIIPSRIEKIQQSDSHTIQIAFRTLKKVSWIEMSWHAESARIVEIERPKQIQGESTLSKQIKFGSKDMALIDIKQKGFERIIELELAFRPKDKPSKIIVLELMGRHSNLFFLNNEHKVITIAKQIRTNKSRLRPISTGDNYAPPPKLQGMTPSKDLSYTQWKNTLSVIPIPLKNALNETFKGISPSFLVQLAGDNKKDSENLLERPVQKITEKNWRYLFSRWSKWLKYIEEENFQLNLNGPTDYMVWSPSYSYEKQNFPISIYLGNYYKQNLESKELNKSFNKLLSDLNKKKKSELLSLKIQEKLYSNTLDLNSLKEKADAILCMNALSKDKIKESQSLYSKVKKLRRSKDIIQKRINHHIEKINFLRETDLFLEYIINNDEKSTEEKLEEISQLKYELEGFILSQTTKPNKASHQKMDFSNILKLKSPSGLSIQIGRNHRQNEFISIKKARKGDIWFHVQECPGSHIVVKASNGSVEESDLKIGADLAAFFSKAKLNKKVSVLMVPTNQLRKLKGTAPGVVSPRESQVVWGDPSNGERYLDQSTKNA